MVSLVSKILVLKGATLGLDVVLYHGPRLRVNTNFLLKINVMLFLPVYPKHITVAFVTNSKH